VEAAMNAESGPQLVILGSSAGGIDALSAIVDTIPASFAAPIVIAQHLDPRRPSHLAEILGRRSPLPIHGVEDRTTLEPGHAYVLPADGRMEVQAGALVPTEADGTRPSPSIDRILSSAAAVYGEGLTAVILSGSGSDGAAGARQVKAAGGTVVIQNPETAAYPSMPEAIPPSIVDIVADADAMGALLQDLVSTPRPVGRGDGDRALRSFLDLVRERAGIDFSTYKKGTILRRLQRRMLATRTADLAEYRKFIEANPEEFGRLTSSFLIKVTEFFRDTELFDYLRKEVVPQLVEDARSGDRELRVWCAGCATGEEPYSLAMLIAEAVGDDPLDVRIFATDVDNDAIAFARRGLYAASVVANVPEPLRERYMTRSGDRYEISKAIRAMTVFGQHDLAQRAPFPRLDLAMCRNVLIYFTPELQRRALHLFAFALRDGGYLALGKSEYATMLAEHFVLADARQKVYRRQGERILIPPARTRPDMSPPSLKLPTARRPGWSQVPALSRDPDRAVTLTERAEQLLMRLPVGIVVVDGDYDIQLINLAGRELLGIHGQAVAEDLIHQLDESLAPKVKAAVDAALRGRRADPLVIERSSITADGTAGRFVELKTEPFSGGDTRAQVAWAMVVVTDVTTSVRNARDLAEAATVHTEERERAVDQAQALASSNEELRAVNRDLTTANAELRTANEELLLASEEVQAATEEVETLNEELQATNEELETLNEELQATFEELNTTNDDLEARSRELRETAVAIEGQRAQADAERLRLLTVLDLIGEPVIVVDAEGKVLQANEAFRSAVGDPGELGLDRDGGPGRDVLRRAAVEDFTDRLRLGKHDFEVVAHHLDGAEGRSGALMFRKTERPRRAGVAKA
jgi:two-component system, chemotaxis family, CheB/CheR fusion protein